MSSYCESKRGPAHDAICEDGLFYNAHYLVVVDGATDKSGRTYDEGRKGGRVARDLILEVFRSLEPKLDKVAILRRLDKAFRAFHTRYPSIDFHKEPRFRPTACIAWYSFAHRELVALGDCKARIDGRWYNDEDFFVNRINGAVRSMVIKELGLTGAQVRKHDLGRLYITPLLRQQPSYQNNPEAPEPFQYWVIDGFPVPKEKIRSWRFKKTPRVIELSSDGYPGAPKSPSLRSYEATLRACLKEDPLCTGRNRSTKGLREDYASFDDRCVLIWKAEP